MMRVNYISNLGLNQVSGGWSGVNYQLYHHLQERFEISYIGPVNPPVLRGEKWVSKASRLAGGKGNFYFFSEKRLKLIAEMVREKSNAEADYDFFLGQTSWLYCQGSRPYACFIDACFPTYLELYLDKKEFSAKDIERICKLEKDWLNRADKVFYSSSWTKQETINQLALEDDPDKQIVVKLGGNINLKKQDRDHYTANHNEIRLLFISFNFERKGGMDCWKAFVLLKEKFPGIQLHIIGQQPPQEVMQTPGVIHHGALNKSDPAELQLYEEILSQSTWLIHPTRMDATPVVVIEAAYFGCPAIAPAVFGIPDLIVDQHTGVLLHDQFTYRDIAEAVTSFTASPQRYQLLRQATRNHALKELNWEAITAKIADQLRRKAELTV